MATISSHLLNGTDGSHAGDVRICLYKIDNEGGRVIIFDTRTDSGGRLQETLDDATMDVMATYELQIDSGKYWLSNNAASSGGGGSSGSENSSEKSRKVKNRKGSGNSNCDEIVFRFRMPERHARYHIPFIISPNNYSVWWSAPE